MKVFDTWRCALLTSACAVAMFGPAGAALAADAADATAKPAASSDNAGEILVTARKVVEKLNDVGMSITAMQGEKMQALGIASPEQLAKAVPGFNFARSSFGVPVYTLRGVGFYDTGPGATPAVSVYQDEVTLPFSILSRGAGLDVKRVEVLKGPQGTLYGQNNTGGAINYIANRPTKELAAGFDASYGSYDKITAGGFISGPLSDTVRARIAAETENGGGWQRSYTRGESHGAARYYSGRMLLDWDPSSALSIKFNLNGWVDKSDTPTAQLAAVVAPPVPSAPVLALRAAAAAYPTTPPDARYTDWDPGKRYRRDQNFWQSSVRGDLDLGSVTLTSITSYGEFNQNDLMDLDGLAVQSYDTGTKAKVSVFSQELRLSGKADKLTWMVGGNYANDKVNSTGDLWPTLSAYPFHEAGSYYKMDNKSVGVFANLDYAITETLKLVGGIRYSDVRMRNDSCTYDSGNGQVIGLQIANAAAHGVTITGANGAQVTLLDGRVRTCMTLNSTTYLPGVVSGQLNQNNVPFNIGLHWKAAPDSLLYANVSRGYKAGAFARQGTFYSAFYKPATQEKLMAYEAGFKVGLRDAHLQINGAAFYYDYSDKQILGKQNDPSVGTLSTLINIPKSRILGSELEVSWNPDRDFHLSLAGSYLDGKIEGNFTNYTFSGALANMGGTKLPATPRWQFTADAEYSHPVSGTIVGFGGAHVYTQSSTFSGVGEEALYSSKAYANLDLRAGLRGEGDRWSVMAFVNNVTDTYSWNFTSKIGVDTATRYANPPRTFGIKVSLRH